MAHEVAAALAGRETLIVEAGTGTGKTYAYLVPALLSGRRVIVSTGTRALQDQLYHRDLPAICAALGRPASVALLKGRANYLCRHRLELATQQAWSRGLRSEVAQPAAARAGLERDHAARRHRRSRGGRRGRPGLAVGDLDPRELPRRRVPALRGLLRRWRAPRSAGGRHRGRQPPPPDGGPGAEGGGLWRAAPGCGCDRGRRGAPVARNRGTVPGLQRRDAADVRAYARRRRRAAALAADGRRRRLRDRGDRCTACGARQ